MLLEHVVHTLLHALEFGHQLTKDLADKLDSSSY